MSSTLGIIKNEAGAIVGTVTVGQDFRRACFEKPHEYMDMIGAVRVVSAGYRVDESFYEFGGVEDDSIGHAWELYRAEYGAVEAAEVLARYVAAYRPDVALVEQRVRTGYSQGDEVRLITWVTLAELKRERIGAGEPRYKVLSAGHDALQSQLEIIGAVARGQFWDVTRHDVTGITYADIDTGEDAVTASAEFALVMADAVSTLAMDEFNPIEELAEFAKYGLLDSDENLEVTAKALN